MTDDRKYNKLLNNIDSDTLNTLHKIGFKLVPLSANHIPSIEWSSIYENSEYWEIHKFNDSIVCSNFKNVASALGKSHIKDPDNNDLFIQVLDVDSEYVYNILDTPIAQLNTHPILKSKIHNFLIDDAGISENELSNLTLIDVLKNYTFVTKTRKPFGFHIWWFSHKQNKPILTTDCNKGYELEIKADKKNGLCTLPPSTHRDDKEFRYSAVGRTDQIRINNNLYFLFIELFNNCLIQKDEKIDGSSNLDNKNSNAIIKPESFYNLSPETIDASAFILSPFYEEHNRNNFSLPFSGLTFNCKISEDSASKIIERYV